MCLKKRFASSEKNSESCSRPLETACQFKIYIYIYIYSAKLDRVCENVVQLTAAAQVSRVPCCSSKGD